MFLKFDGAFEIAGFSVGGGESVNVLPSFLFRQFTGVAGSGDRIVAVSDRPVGTRGLYPGESVVTPIIVWIGKSGLMEHSNGI